MLPDSWNDEKENHKGNEFSMCSFLEVFLYAMAELEYFPHDTKLEA